MRSTNRHSFIRSLKRKGLKEEIVIKIGLYDLVTSTTLESNKSPCFFEAIAGSGSGSRRQDTVVINAQHCMRAYCTQYHPIFQRASWLPGSAVSLWSTHPHVLLSLWKSHPLEGSCQEAIPRLYTTF